MRSVKADARSEQITGKPSFTRQAPVRATPGSGARVPSRLCNENGDAPKPRFADYPFAPHYLQIGEHRIHYLDEKVAGSQPDADSDFDSPILMVHGNPTWSYFWRGLIRGLRSRWRTVAVDHLGCGLSDKPGDYQYCLDNHIHNLCQVVDHLGMNGITLMAHDWGGAIGLGTLLERKDRFRRIVLFNTGAFPPPYIPWRIRICRTPWLGRAAVQGLNLFARAATTMATEQKGGLPKPIAEAYLAPYNNWSNRIAIYRFVKDIPKRADQVTWRRLEQIESRLNELRSIPKLIVWGMKDWCFRAECLDRFIRHWPEAEIRRIPGAGHYVVEDAADEVQTMVAEFLDRTS